MILVIVLFILVFLISFFLSLYSMRDFQHTPSEKEEYGVFLIKNPVVLNTEILGQILDISSKKDSMISFERLFKGSEVALVIFAPRVLVSQFKELDLLELEDYTDLNLDSLNIWEVDIRNTQNLKVNLPILAPNDRIWVQTIIKNNTAVRIAVYSENADNLKQITEKFQQNFKNSLPKIPKPYSKKQLFEFYKTRSMIKGEKQLKLKPEDILSLCLFF